MSDITALRRELLHRRIAAAAAQRPARDIVRLSAVEAPLSHAQERLWFLQQLGLVGGAYNVGVAVRLRGRLDVAALAAGLTAVVRRHESLRTRFLPQGSTAIQTIDPPWTVSLAPVAIASDEARRRSEAVMQRPFDLAGERLLRVELMRLSAEEHLLVLALHHIIADGWSMGVFVDEVAKLYAAFAAGRPSPLADLPVQYADYAAWQRRWLGEGILERQLDYWTRRLAGAPAGLALPADRPRPSVPSFRGAAHEFTLTPGETAALTELARAEGATLFMALLAVFNVLLARWSGQDDLVVGTPIAGRTRAETEGLIGLFVNMLALRSDLSGEPSFRSLLRQVRDAALEAYAHQDLPFEKLVEALHPVRDLGREPVFQVIFALQNMPVKPGRMAGLAVEPWEVGQVAAKFDLELAMAEVDGGLSGSLIYATDLFDAGTIARMAGHFLRLVERIVAHPDRPVSQLALLSAPERRQLVLEWNDTDAKYATDRCVHELVAAQGAKDPDVTALVFGAHSLSYGDLDHRANQLAHQLRELGVGPDVLVGLCVERSFEMVIGLLGILKAGGAYLPLDPGYPADRLAFMLEDARVRLVLTTAAVAEGLEQILAKSPLSVMPGLVPGIHVVEVGARGTDVDGRDKPGHDGEGAATNITILRLDADWPDIARQPTTAPASVSDPDHLAYVIYTSGSTGKPKGVMIPHRGAINLAEAQLAQLPLTAADRILQFASFSFDAAVWDVLMSFRVGAALVLADRHDLLPGEPLRDLLVRQRVTTALLPPSALAVLPSAALPDLRILIAGGEAASAELLRPWLADRLVLNAYGPTEASVCTTMFRCGADARVPIGRPLSNTRAHVLDRHLEPVPVGVAGELYIGGVGLARGYLGRPGLTGERFVPNPFAPGERLYRTGDLARLRVDGEIEFLGRIDHQVKIRGFRIELGEIETTLLAHADVEQAAVIAREDVPGERRLVAYVVGHGDAVLEAADLRRHLQKSLPDHMVPAAFVQLDRLPLSPNGKLDRKALPAPEIQAKSAVAPRNETEHVLATIFAEILGVERVGVYDNFFELGGDSIQSIQVVSRARAQNLALTPQQVFQHQTVAALAGVADAAPVTPAVAGQAIGRSPLTPIQRWFFEQHGPIEHFNQALLLEVPADIRPEPLARALSALLAQHDALRSRFARDVDGWVQDILPVEDGRLEFTHFDLAELGPQPRREQLEVAAATLQESLDPVAGRMMAAAWFDFGPQEPGRLLLVIHHLVIDGVSWRILIEDLVTAYGRIAGGEPAGLPPKTTAFRDWSLRLAGLARELAASHELEYWIATCRDAPPLPLDRPVDPARATYGDTEGLADAFSPEETKALLQALPQARHSRISDALLSALAVAVADFGAARGQSGTAVLVDLEGHGREDLFAGVDLSRTVGWFTSMFPVRLDAGEISVPAAAAGGPAAGSALARVAEQLHAVPRNGVGWGLLRYLDAATVPVLRALPPPTIAFNFLGRFDAAARDGWRLAEESAGSPVAAERGRDHLLEVDALVSGDRLRLQWRWSRHAHDRASIADLAARFAAVLRGLIRHAAQAGVPAGASDFALAGLDAAALARLVERHPDIEEVLPLAPMQKVMHRHAMARPDSTAYHEQLCLTVDGPLDARALRKAWHALITRHACLRVAVVDDPENGPRQVVRRATSLPWHAADWSGLDSEAAAETERVFLAQDRARGFDLAAGSLLRAALLRHAPERHVMVLSFHHILLDGWSIPILLSDLGALYAAASRRQQASLPPARAYRDYLAWLAGADRAAARVFWRRRLAGLRTGRLALRPGEPWTSPNARGEHRITLSRELTRLLQVTAQAQRLTVSTLVQGAWAVALSAHGGGDDVVFGMTISGRPAELAGVERMVGLFINLLPRWVQFDPTARVADWLHVLQAHQMEEQSHGWCSLVDIEHWIGAAAAQALFDSVMVFENYPLAAPAAAGSAAGLSVSAIAGREEGVHYPLCLVVGPGERMTLRLAFSRRRFAAAAVRLLAGHLVQAMEAISADPDQPVAVLRRRSVASPQAAAARAVMAARDPA